MTLTRINTNSITDGSIVNADINTSAAIAGTKISPDFGSQNIITTGRLGLGTSSPGTSLSIGASATGGYNGGVLLNRGASAYNFYEAADGTNSVVFGLDNSLTHAKIGSVNSYPIALYTGNSPRLYIDTSGRVGIGTTSVGHKLDLLVGGGADGINVYNNATGAAYYQLATTSRSYKIEATGTDLRFYDNTGSAERARIDSSGRLLVGTSSAPTGSKANSLTVNEQLLVSPGLGIYSGLTGNITATTGTIVFTFKNTTVNQRAAMVRLSVASRSTSNTASNSPCAQYQFQLFKTSATVCSLNGAASIYEYTFVRATHFAFADAGSGVCTVTLTNPTGQALVSQYKVEILGGDGALSWTLDSVAVT